MNQKDKAREVVARRYHFDKTVRSESDAVIAAADRAAGTAKGRLGASFKKKGSRSTSTGEQVSYELMGPGGLVSIATIVVTITQNDATTNVSCRLDQFLFQKRSLGMKPTINGSAQLDKFVDGLKTELDAMGSSR